MPLRSVEAATRDDAIAAAREQFGPHARVVGVRRVRSGGVLGFFTTERYVAEVADQLGGPGLPTPSTGAAASVASYDSPLASASPARAAAPARNAAAAWAAEAARSGTEFPPTGGARPAAGRSPAAARPAGPMDDDERLDELAGLLGAAPAPRPTPAPARHTAAPARPAFDRQAAAPDRPAAAATRPDAAPAAGPAALGEAFPRATFARTSRSAAPQRERALAEPAPAFPAPVPVAQPEAPARSPFAAALGAADDAGSPSPFTAALARMVAGDRDVRQAVAQALEEPAARPAEQPALGSVAEPAPRPRRTQQVDAPDTPAPRPSLAAAIRSADPSMRSMAVHQEETPVGEQVATPPSTSTADPAEVPSWAAQGAVTPSPSSRQEEIAEALRSALAQDHSDEALAGILRKMLAGDSPQDALAEPAVPLPAPAPTEPVAAVETPAPVGELEPVGEPAPVVVPPTAIVEAAPAPRIAEVAASWDQRTSGHALFGTSPVAPAATDLGWDTPVVAPTTAQTPLWGEPVVEQSAPAERADAPIWDEVALREPAPAPIEARQAPVVPEPGITGLLFAEPVTPAVTEPEIIAAAEPDVAEAEAAEPESVAVAEQEVVAVAEQEVVAVAEQPSLPVQEESAPEPVVTEAAPEPVVEELAPVEAEPEPAEQAPAAEVSRTREVTGTAVAEDVAELAPLLARTASDPAPMSMSLDATTVMPRVSLLPPLPGSRGRGLPPVPPSSGRPAVPPSRSAAPVAEPKPAATEDREEPTMVAQQPEVVEKRRAGAPAARSLATVTRLPVAPLMAGPDLPEMPELDDEAAAAPAPTPRTAPGTPEEVVAGLVALGLPRELLGAGFTAAVAADGTYAALTHALAAGLPEVPELPTGAGEVLFIVGPGVETLRAARSLAASLRLDPDRVQWATRGDLAGLAPKASRMTTIDAALDRRQEAANAGTLTIVAVDAPLRSDAYWMAQMLAIWSPAAVWAVVEATRKPEDLELWLDGLARVDALAVQDTDLSVDPAAVLQRLTAPVALLDGVRATPHRWASLLCERLDAPQA